MDPTTSSPNSAGNRAVIRPSPFAALHRTTVSLSRNATRRDSMTSSTPSGTSSSSSRAVSFSFSDDRVFPPCFVSEVFSPVLLECVSPASPEDVPFKLCTSDRAPRSYRHVTTRGFKKSKPILCASLHASWRTSALPAAARDDCKSRASPHARSATPRSASRVPSLKIAASARATPGTKKSFRCSCSAKALALSRSFISAFVSAYVTSAPLRPPSAAVAQSKNVLSALGMSGLVSSLARSVAARSLTMPGSDKYRS
mmetsp:Transcript_9738/g.32145  ORF Transcript_9738/g.32145 Transcript_9738/m.32145 type:complete len:256 (+) Transcript_9738:2782-3549(+)